MRKSFTRMVLNRNASGLLTVALIVCLAMQAYAFAFICFAGIVFTMERR